MQSRRLGKTCLCRNGSVQAGWWTAYAEMCCRMLASWEACGVLAVHLLNFPRAFWRSAAAVRFWPFKNESPPGKGGN